eukprot:Platyproteum_vivax@DN2745_c0_g1_i1.p1
MPNFVIWTFFILRFLLLAAPVFARQCTTNEAPCFEFDNNSLELISKMHVDHLSSKYFVASYTLQSVKIGANDELTLDQCTRNNTIIDEPQYIQHQHRCYTSDSTDVSVVMIATLEKVSHLAHLQVRVDSVNGIKDKVIVKAKLHYVFPYYPWDFIFADVNNFSKEVARPDSLVNIATEGDFPKEVLLNGVFSLSLKTDTEVQQCKPACTVSNIQLKADRTDEQSSWFISRFTVSKAVNLEYSWDGDGKTMGFFMDFQMGNGALRKGSINIKAASIAIAVAGLVVFVIIFPCLCCVCCMFCKCCKCLKKVICCCLPDRTKD